MFRAQRNGKSPSSGERVDFKFSNLQAVQVPKLWDRLLVSIISVETGKTIARSSKAQVRNGNCQWTESLSESIWISHDDSAKELEEHLFKFVVSMGSARSGILGEATVNIARFYTSSRSSAPVSLPLKKCNYGTVLQVKIQCLTPRTKPRVEGPKYSGSNGEVVDEDFDDAGSRSNESVSSLTRSAKSPPSQDLGSNSLLGKIKNMEVRYTPSGSNQNLDSSEDSIEKEKFYRGNHMNELKYNLNGSSRNSSPRSNYPVDEEDLSVSNSNNSFKSRITHDDQEQEYEQSPLTNIGSSKNLLEAAEDTIEELREEAKMWERNSQKLTFDLEISKEGFSNQSKKLADVQMELTAARAEVDQLKQEVDQLKTLLQESVVKQRATTGPMYHQSEGGSHLQRALENELKVHKESNADLALQLKRNQESNIELVCILQELEEVTEKQRAEIEDLLVVKSKFDENSVENRSLQLHIQQLEESEKSLQANLQILEQALENKISELQSEQTSNIQSLSALKKEYKSTLSSKEEEINNLESKLSVCISERDENEATRMQEIESLKQKVSEMEKECIELTNENLELLNELKESKKAIEMRNMTIEEGQKQLEDYGLKIEQLESLNMEREAQISELENEKEELQENMAAALSESNVTSKCLDNLRNDLMVLSSSVDSHVSANKSLERKASELEKTKREVELRLFEVEEENVQLLEHVSALEGQMRHLNKEQDATRMEFEKSESLIVDLRREVGKLQDTEKLLLDAREECEYVKTEKEKLQDSAESLIEECNVLQKSYKEMTKGKAELYEQCSRLEIELMKSQENLSVSSKSLADLEEKYSSVLEEHMFKEKSLSSHLNEVNQENWRLKEKISMEESLLNQMYMEKTVEIENFQREVEHLKEEIEQNTKTASEAFEQISSLNSQKSKLETSLEEARSRAELVAHDLRDLREVSDSKIQDLTTEVSALKQGREKLKFDYERKSKLLGGYRTREERRKTMENDLELKLTVSEYERQQLIEETGRLKDQLRKTSNLQNEILDLNRKLHDKENLEASLRSVSSSYEELKSENISFVEKISILEASVSAYEDCKRKNNELEEKLLQLEGDLTAKEALHSQDAEMKNELSRIKSGNLQYQLRIQQLEGEKNECLKKVHALEEDLKTLSAKQDQPESRSKQGDHETDSHYDMNYLTRIEMLEAELDEALDANNKYRAQLQRLKSEGGRNSSPTVPAKSKAEGEIVTKERFERTKSSLETELKDLRDRYLEMSLKYAEVEAEREDLVMQLKTNKSARRRFQFLDNP